MSHNRRRRVFILGAGFSMPAAMPDAIQLTETLLETVGWRGDEELRAWAESIQRRIKHLHRADGPRVNVEQLFEYAAFDRELLLMGQHECSTVGWGTPRDSADWIASWIHWMEYFLAGVLIKEQQAANAALLQPFARGLRRDDTVLTFNYDTLLERALELEGTQWWHGFAKEEKSDGITVLKLHGSTDWWLVPVERLPPESERTGNPKVLYQSPASGIDWDAARKDASGLAWEHRFVLARVPSLAEAERYNAQHTGLSAGTAPWPGLGGLGLHKPLHRLLGSGVVWRRGLDALSEADEIYVVGWSASPYDTMARFHFASVLALRSVAPARVVVIDPRVVEQRANYTAVFGDFEPIARCVEDLDWGEVLRH